VIKIRKRKNIRPVVWSAFNCIKYLLEPYLNNPSSYSQEYQRGIDDFLREYGREFIESAKKEIEKRRRKAKRREAVSEIDEIEKCCRLLTLFFDPNR
jgi:hypothetical protein